MTSVHTTEASRKVVTLPNADEMFERLVRVENNSHLVKYLYPEFIKDAGRRFSALGIVNMFVSGVEAFMDGYDPGIETSVRIIIPDWIDALIDDKEVAAATKQLFGELIASLQAV